MSNFDHRSAMRPAPDAVLTAIADYVAGELPDAWSRLSAIAEDQERFEKTTADELMNLLVRLRASI